jgi:hypothetical protein
MRMMMRRAGRMLERQVVEGAVLLMTMTMITKRERRTHKELRKKQGKRRKHTMGKGMGRGKRRGRETVNKRYCQTNPSGR